MKDGRVLDRRSSGLYAADRSYIGRIWFFRDVTEAKTAERRIEADLRRTQTQMDIIGQIGQSDALLSGDVEALAREVTELASRATGCERVNVWLFDDEETELRCIDLFEATPARHSSGMTLGEAEFGNEIAVLKTSRYVAADDPLTDPRTAGSPTLVVESGGRTREGLDKLHVWWRLTEPAEGEDLALLCRLRGDIAVKVGGDTHFRSAHQPIRVAGTVYHKSGFRRLVTIRRHEPRLEVDLHDFAEAVAAMPPLAGVGSEPGPAVEKPSTWEVLTTPVRDGGRDDWTRLTRNEMVFADWFDR